MIESKHDVYRADCTDCGRTHSFSALLLFRVVNNLESKWQCEICAAVFKIGPTVRNVGRP